MEVDVGARVRGYIGVKNELQMKYCFLFQYGLNLCDSIAGNSDF